MFLSEEKMESTVNDESIFALEKVGEDQTYLETQNMKIPDVLEEIDMKADDIVKLYENKEVDTADFEDTFDEEPIETDNPTPASIERLPTENMIMKRNNQ